MSDELQDEHAVKPLETGEGGADEIPMTFPQRVSSLLVLLLFLLC